MSARRRRCSPSLLLVALAAFSAGCSELFVEPAPSADGAGLALTLAPAQRAQGGAREAFDKAERARIRLQRADGAVVVDTEVDLPPSGGERAVEVEVDIAGDAESLQLRTELLWQGQTLFQGAASVRLERGRTTSAEVALDAVPAGIAVPATAGPITTLGGTLQLGGAVVFATGDTVANASVTWTALDPAIATVSAAGLVTARAEGDARMRAAYLAHATIMIVRVQAVVARIDVAPASLESNVGAESRLSAVARDAAGNALVRTISWQSSAPQIAPVSADGTVRGLATGTATIVASAGGTSSAPVAIKVTLVPVASVSITPPTATVLAGETVALQAIPRDSAGNPLTGRSVQWQSGNPQVATVAADGVVTGVSPGQATITASSEGRSGTATVVVVQPVIGLSATDVTITTIVGANPAPVSVPVTNAGTGTLSGLGVSVAHAPAEGWLTATLTGTTAPATITLAVNAAGLGEGAYAATVTVSSSLRGVVPRTISVRLVVQRVPVARVVVQPAADTLQIGQTAQLQATTLDSAGNVLPGRAVVWHSSDPQVATVSATGLVTAVAGGHSIITATSEGVSGTASVTVLAPIIVLTPPSVTFTTTVNQNPPSQGVTISNGGSGVLSGLTVQISHAGPSGWLSGLLASLGNSHSLSLSVNAAGLAAGTYQATVTVSSSAPGVQSVALPVTLTVLAGPVISNLAVTLDTVNDPTCSNGGSSFDVTFDFVDPNGDVTPGVSVVVNAFVFSSGTSGSFNPTWSRTGTGFAGTIRFGVCTVYGGSSSITRTITLQDDAGLTSNAISATTPKPVGANTALQASGAVGASSESEGKASRRAPVGAR